MKLGGIDAEALGLYIRSGCEWASDKPAPMPRK